MEQISVKLTNYQQFLMCQYLTTKQEDSLLKLPFNTNQLKLLQKNSVSRIQIVSFKGIKALKSYEDCYRKIRILVVSLLIKIYLDYSPVNAQRLERLKKIIYSAKLTQLTQQKGLVRQHLLKLVAEQFKNLKIGHQSETDIMKIFNCSPFFDQIVMVAMKEENPLIVDSDCELEVWIDREMSVKIVWNQDYTGEEKEEELGLMGLGEEFHASKDCKSLECNYKSFQQYLRFSTQAFFSNADEDISQIFDRTTREQLFSCPMSPSDRLSQQQNLFMHPSLYTSVQTKSPSLRLSGNQHSDKQNWLGNHKVPEIKLFDSPAPRPMKKKSSLDSDNLQKQKLIKKRSSKASDQGSSLWGILCCRNL